MNRDQPTILVTGINGQVGFELVRTLQGLGHIVALDRAALDLADAARVKEVVRSIAPHVIVNAAAYTSVDQAEDEAEQARLLNAEGPRLLAAEARRLNAWLVHYSTDYVFDGTKRDSYVEGDVVCPLNVYGQTKADGEHAIAASGCKHLIFRTSWVYGLRGANFLRTMLRLAAQRPELSIVADQYGAPTWSRSIAELTANVLSQVVAAEPVRDRTPDDRSGIYHLTNQGKASWFEFAQEIFRLWPLPSQPKVEPISARSYNAKARRPENSCLSNDKLFETFGVRAPDWRVALKMCAEMAG
ncbi:dTDP-4-dehydrorhamnose reductase [Paraburkholderia sp. GAS348]|uniref:dTDP-4-dehydrorhamnose reductase n=1 Tax=Paraburkholderia sp. GAS348 TaxID=3035132 RepID=UPI003D25930A